MPKVSAIVVSWNGKQHLEEMISSLLNQSYKDMEIILVINGSTDGSQDFVKERFPGERFKNLRVIELEKNIGFGPGVNAGIRNSNARYIAFFNDDMKVEKDCIKNMVELLEEREKDNVAACSAKLLYYDKPDTINYAGGVFNYMGFAWPNRMNEKDRELPVEETDYGGICMIRKNVLDEVGLFDENIPMYHSDVDLCFRIRIYGYKLLFNPKAVAYHKYDFKRNPDKFYDLEFHRRFIIKKYYSRKNLILIAPASLLIEVATLYFALSSGWFKKKIKSYSEFKRYKEAIKKEREKIQKERRIKDKKFMKNFVGHLRFEMIKSKGIDWFLSPLLNAYWKLIRKVI
ncbi:MAG: hypothetical protein PWQ87_87 [Candidatus Woesearchaeota archaeon]|nr:hypothetical protein [Candidatus Woesearchaeota archaeon]